ncbi:MarR family winged helix-turn-helix transcriptional regulator [Nocardia cyriacigeorgica]|uniref:MarR family winged helix-turn-helix transcriptional regulator n=1 Tax=Nocardia cyriacigeorgica TaxID=135487 RepID=UPI0018962F4D|nr:MarR family transcriptional regulator [Nocardia cyriacigeorgica]MBF6435162.1 MarR family transcriptional regulator [Nocardia cyriacigeorgica]MBF6454772.1 MarR family transcriptional regulator [Nocardia cyriacigeorgica]MBF6479292.1 MarR family transcriptional regulator [Nocardia cyriacigeorgica]MBF6552666.1 MarR family transcriptional regulator [Nocardia cyriacigeorgica]
MDTDEEMRFDRGESTPARLKKQLSRLTSMTAAQMTRLSREALRATGARKDHFVVLAALAEFGPASQATLSERTSVYKSDLVSVLNDLEEGRWVRRAPDPADKRRNVITITAAGEQRLAELDRVLDTVNEQIMTPLDHEERAQLFALLGRVNAHLAATARTADALGGHIT